MRSPGANPNGMTRTEVTFASEVSFCPACGYPTLGSGVCYFCRPLVAAAHPSFPCSLAEPSDAASEASVIVRTTARPARESRTDAERSLSSGAVNTIAAAG